MVYLNATSQHHSNIQHAVCSHPVYLHSINKVPYKGKFGWGIFWRTIQVKAIGEEKFGK